MSAIAAVWPQAVPVDTGLMLADTTAVALCAWHNIVHTEQAKGYGHQSGAELRPAITNTALR